MSFEESKIWIDRLNKAMRSNLAVLEKLERIKSGTPPEEIALLNEKLKDAEERGARALLEWAKSKIYLDGQCESVEFSDLEAYFSEGKK